MAGKQKRLGVAVDPSLRGRGPKKGAHNAGRPPNEFRAKLRSLVDRNAVVEHLEKVLSEGPEAHPDDFWRALTYATEHGHGKPQQHVQQTGDVTIRVVRE